jgi:hypothetical protein
LNKQDKIIMMSKIWNSNPILPPNPIQCQLVTYFRKFTQLSFPPSTLTIKTELLKDRNTPSKKVVSSQRHKSHTKIVVSINLRFPHVNQLINPTRFSRNWQYCSTQCSTIALVDCTQTFHVLLWRHSQPTPSFLLRTSVQRNYTLVMPHVYFKYTIITKRTHFQVWPNSKTRILSNMQ